MSQPLQRPPKMSGKGTRFDHAASAAAIAVFLVVLGQTYHTLGNERWIIWFDALANEWLIWFTVVYVAEIAVTSALTRFGGVRSKAIVEKTPITKGESS